MPYKVFLSHSHHDEPLARLIKTEVEAASKTTVYLAQDDLQLGTNLTKKVLAAIEASDALLVLLTRRSEGAPWVHQEIGAAVRTKLVVPIVERGADTTRLGMIADRERLTFDIDDPSAAFTSLAAFLRAKAVGKDRMEKLQLAVLGLAVGVVVAFGQEEK